MIPFNQHAASTFRQRFEPQFTGGSMAMDQGRSPLDDPRYLTVEEVAARLGCSRHQVYRRIARGDIKAIQVQVRNLQYRVPESELEQYIDGGGAMRLTTAAPPRDMLRVPEVARMLGFTVETVRRMAYEGRLPYIRGAGAKGHLRIPRAAVEDYLAQVK